MNNAMAYRQRSFTNKNLRVLVVSNCPLNENQGSGYVICGYASQLVGRGHEVTAFDPEQMILLPGMYRFKRLRLLFGYTWTALRQGLFGQFDIIELWGGPGWLACLILTGVPGRRYRVISRSNGLESYCSEILDQADNSNRSGRSVFSFHRLCEIGFRRADGLSVVSMFDAIYASKSNFQPEGRLIAIDNPLSESWLGLDVNYSREPIIGFVGSWLDRKGADILPSVVQEVLQRHDSVKFVLAGVGDAGKSAMRDLLGTHPRVTVLDPVERQALRHLYDTFFVILVPSVYESFGLVSAEGMACGAALVATPVGFAAGLRDGHEYISLPNRTTNAISSALLDLLADENERQRIAKAGYLRVQSLSWELAVDRLESFYRSILDR